MHAPEELAQVLRSGALGFMIGRAGPMFGILIANIVLKFFKLPPKTLKELWLEAVRHEQESEANVGSCPLLTVLKCEIRPSIILTKEGNYTKKRKIIPLTRIFVSLT